MARRVFASSKYSMDEILKRPYGPEVPMGSIGAKLWASSPQGWGFGSDVHWMYLSNLNVFDIEIRDGQGLLVPDKAIYYRSHIHIANARRLDQVASASFTFTRDRAENPLSKPFQLDKRWTSWSSGKREDWWQVQFGTPRTLTGLKLWFFSDPPAGECRPPESYKVEVWKGGWVEVRASNASPEKPVAGENSVSFAPVRTDRVRLVFKHAGERFYTGLYGFEALGPVERTDRSKTSQIGLQVSGDKYITNDDVLVATLKVTAPKGRSRSSVRIRFASTLFPELGPITSWPPKRVNYEDSKEFQIGGREAVASLQLSFSPEGIATQPSEPEPEWRATLSPGQALTLHVAVAIDTYSAKTEHCAAHRSNPQTAATKHAKEYQSWFDDNVAYFSCSDPWITKQYYHRAYVLRKNMMEPDLGRMKWPTFVEGRWRSGWYPNVITYGGGHQIREARWLRDPQYWEGHLRTYAHNEKANGVYANFVKPNEIGGGQYTDWITSTAWDGYLVHPDRKFLGEVALKLAANTRGWAKTYDPDGDGLLKVDSHWWTGMEWQPSFFYFSGYRRGKQNGGEPEQQIDLDRVDLTAYEYGNALATARILKEIGAPAKAKEFDSLAERIATAMHTKMWDPESKFFYSLRASDGAIARVKEVIGVYPFYFDAVPYGKEFERAWESILDPKQFWTKWPVASASMECAAFSQTGWPDFMGTGCMWNGPTWPHANSLVMSAMANTIRGMRDGGTKGRKDIGTEGRRDKGTKGQEDGGTKGQEDGGTKGQRDGESAISKLIPASNPVVASRSSLPPSRPLSLGPFVPPSLPDALWQLFTSFTKAQFKDQDFLYPWTGEFYNGDTGQWKTPERDYNHSTYLDLVITNLVGIVPRNDNILEIDPLVPEGKLAYFILDGQQYRGHDVTVVWDAPGGKDRFGDKRKGLDVYVDRKRVVSLGSLGRILAPLKAKK